MQKKKKELVDLKQCCKTKDSYLPNIATDQLCIDAPCKAKAESVKSAIFGKIYVRCMYLKSLYSDVYLHSSSVNI